MVPDAGFRPPAPLLWLCAASRGGQLSTARGSGPGASWTVGSGLSEAPSACPEGGSFGRLRLGCWRSLAPEASQKQES